LNDDQLLLASRQGDSQAFKQLIKRYEARVAAVVFGMLGNCPEAEDVGQETFIRFYKNLDQFKGKSSVATYLTRIAINLSLNELKRRKKKLKRFVHQIEDEDFEIPDENSENVYNEQQEIVHQAIQRLDPKFRAVVVLRLMEGYSTVETANILGVPVGTVLSRLTRAQTKLKEYLSPLVGGN